jgi:hypothetical protein
MNEELVLLEKLQDILDDVCNGVSVKIKLAEVISELDEKVTKFEQWADKQN